MVKLTDSQQWQVIRATNPLDMPQRDAFLGPYRGWDNPAAVERGKSFNSVAYGWAPMGSHHVKLSLKPGEAKEILFVLGYHENPVDQKFDPPRSQRVNKRTVQPTIETMTKRQEPSETRRCVLKPAGRFTAVDMELSDHEHTDFTINLRVLRVLLEFDP